MEYPVEKSKQKSEFKENLKAIDQNIVNRILGLQELAGRLATILNVPYKFDLKAVEITTDTITAINIAAAKARDLNPDKTEDQLQLRILENKCIDELFSLYINLNPLPKSFKLRKLNTIANRVSNTIEAYIRENYIPIINAFYSNQEQGTEILQNLSGTNLLKLVYKLSSVRVDELSPKPNDNMAVHEIYLSSGQITSTPTKFYDGELVTSYKNPIPEAALGWSIYLVNTVVRQNFDQQGIAISMTKEAIGQSKAMNTYLFHGEIKKNNLKRTTQGDKYFKNIDFDSYLENKYDSNTNKSTISANEIIHIFVVAPGNELFDKVSSKKHQIFFLTEKRAKEFIAQAAQHPYWYDKEKGWNLNGWPHLMDAKDRVISNFEKKFNHDQIKRSFLFTEKAKLPVFESYQQELNGLRAVISALLQANSDVTEILEEAIAQLLKNQGPGEEVELHDFKKTTIPHDMLNTLAQVTNKESKGKLITIFKDALNDFNDQLDQEVQISPK